MGDGDRQPGGDGPLEGSSRWRTRVGRAQAAALGPRRFPCALTYTVVDDVREGLPTRRVGHAWALPGRTGSGGGAARSVPREGSSTGLQPAIPHTSSSSCRGRPHAARRARAFDSLSTWLAGAAPRGTAPPSLRVRRVRSRVHVYVLACSMLRLCLMRDACRCQRNRAVTDRVAVARASNACCGIRVRSHAAAAAVHAARARRPPHCAPAIERRGRRQGPGNEVADDEHGAGPGRVWQRRLAKAGRGQHAHVGDSAAVAATG
eukprot:363371-Chlamydomonas_euryale.AAC.21